LRCLSQMLQLLQCQLRCSGCFGFLV
jgi:hypothetical protein